VRILDLFLDRMSETALFEMARSRHNARELVTALSPEIVDHLIKLFVFHSPENQNHWISEINTWLGKIDKIYLKPSRKKPSWQTVYNWMVFDSSPHYNDQYIEALVKKWQRSDYQNLILYDFDSELVLNQILKILEQACRDIAQPNKFVSVEDYLETTP
jgi:hypothetical protein